MATFAGQYGPEPFIDRAGNRRADAVVKVLLPDGVTLAPLWADRAMATPLANPLPTGVAGGQPGLDAAANGLFYAAPGQYVLVAEVDGAEVYRGPVSVRVDPDEAEGAIDHPGDATAAHAALAIAFTPTGAVEATNLQAAVAELDDMATTEVVTRALADTLETGARQAADELLGTDVADLVADLGIEAVARADADLAEAGARTTADAAEAAARADADALLVPQAQLGVANGVATLGPDGNLPAGQLPTVVLSVNGQTGVVELDLVEPADLAAEAAARAAADAQLVPLATVGVAGGVAELDGLGLVPADQLATEAATAARVLRGDRTWGPPPPAGAVMATRPAGAVGETMPRTPGPSVSVNVLASGRLQLFAIDLVEGEPVTAITFVSGGTTAATPVAQWFSLWADDRDRLALTADDGAAAWAASVAKTLPLVGGPYVPDYSGLHYVGIVVVATVVPSLIGAGSPANPTATHALPPVVQGSSSVGLTNPASAPATAAALNPVGNTFAYAFVT